MEIATIIFLCVVVYVVGMIISLPVFYPNDVPSTVLWWPIWLVTVLPIRIVKFFIKFIGTVYKEIVKEIKV